MMGGEELPISLLLNDTTGSCNSDSYHRAPPGARYDPIGPGDGPPNLRGGPGPRFPGGGGGMGPPPPNPFGAFGGGGFI